MNDASLSLKTDYQKRRKSLAENGVDTAALDARLLLCHVLGLTHEEFIMQSDRVLTVDEKAQIDAAFAQRLQGRPVAKIIGVKEFYGRDFKTTDETLDPRPDSETLIEVVLQYVRQYALQDKTLRVLDLGTGTGCLVLTLLAELPQATGVAVDQSLAALAVAKENATALNVQDRVTFVQSDWLQKIDGVFDLVISNPPYIPEGDLDQLAVEVRAFDPVDALVGGQDGLDPYREIIPQLHRVLRDNGLAAFELGQGQDQDVADMLWQARFTQVKIAFDLGGIGRVVSGIFRQTAE